MYKVRLTDCIYKPGEPTPKFLTLDINLPFVPFPGMHISLPNPDITYTVETVTWCVKKETFLCSLELDDSSDDFESERSMKEEVEWRLYMGWQELDAQSKIPLASPFKAIND